jgi:hypothetical protein
LAAKNFGTFFKTLDPTIPKGWNGIFGHDKDGRQPIREATAGARDSRNAGSNPSLWGITPFSSASLNPNDPAQHGMPR